MDMNLRNTLSFRNNVYNKYKFIILRMNQIDAYLKKNSNIGVFSLIKYA